jgi:hypothetical protein
VVVGASISTAIASPATKLTLNWLRFLNCDPTSPFGSLLFRRVHICGHTTNQRIMILSLPDLLILALATWYLAHAIVKTHGPFKLFATLRERYPLGGLLTCLHCAALWIALLLLLLWQTPAQPVIYVPAVAGAALMLATYTGASHA